jgi:hypothetical protein
MNRARFRYNASIAIAGLIAFLGATPVATSGFVRTGPQPFYAYLLLVLLLIPAGVAVWGWRAGTDADAAGLRVRPGFRSHPIAWSQVSALVPQGRRVSAELTDGRAVVLPAVAPADLPRLVAASGQSLDAEQAEPPSVADPGEMPAEAATNSDQ